MLCTGGRSLKRCVNGSAIVRRRRVRSPEWRQLTQRSGAVVTVQVVAISTPQDDARWRWRIGHCAGEVIEESRETFATIASAVEHGSKRLRQMDAVDNSVPSHSHRAARYYRVP